MLILFIFVLLLSFYLLSVIVDEFFIESLDLISKRLHLSSDVAGATFMAVGSSAPELFTSLIAVFRPGDHADIGAGTIVGSAIFNILVIIGASALYRKAKLNWQPVVRDTGFYVLSILALLFTFRDGQIFIGEAVFFIVLYVVYIFAVIKWKDWFPYTENEDPIEVLDEGLKKSKLARLSKQLMGFLIPDSKKNEKKYLVTFGMSIVMIAALSFVLVEAAVGIGELLHINPTIIALTVLAAGTSIPDLLASMIVAKKGRGDMAVSNAVGSNIFDILFGLGFPWLLVLSLRGGSISVANENLGASVILLFATVIAVFFLIYVRQWTIGRKAGLLLIALYIAYVGWNVLQVI